MTNLELINLAIEAKKNGISPTGYFCGAAVLAEDGKVYTGCNFGSEDALFNICAERVAICKMLSEGVKKFSKIAVVGGMGDCLICTTPCGICRQCISEFGQDIEVIMGYKNESGELVELVKKISDLLPGAYVMKD